MPELEMTNDVETEDFTDELSDEALDRARDLPCHYPANCGTPCRAGN